MLHSLNYCINNIIIYIIYLALMLHTILGITNLFTHLNDYIFALCSINYAHQVVMVVDFVLEFILFVYCYAICFFAIGVS